MAQPANSQSTYKAVGNREDLDDLVAEVSPDDNPLTNNIGDGAADGKYTEWQKYALSDATDENAVIEGDDAVTDAPEQRERVGNYCQLADKVARVTSTQEAVETAGVASEMDFQVAAKTRVLMNDIEKQMLSNKPSVAGSDTVARQSAGFESWIETNENRGVGGSAGGFASGIVGAPTDGTQRPFTETILKDVMKQRADAGNSNKMIQLYMGSHVKTVASTFTGISEQRTDTGKKAVHIIGAADYYLSDFGEIAFIYSQFIRPRTALFVDPDMVSQRKLQGFTSEDLAKTGHTQRKMISCEYTLRVDNEAAHGVAADLAAS